LATTIKKRISKERGKILQWIVDSLIRTDVNEGELLLKELFIEDCIFCYREEPHMLAHIPDKVTFVGGLEEEG